MSYTDRNAKRTRLLLNLAFIIWNYVQQNCDMESCVKGKEEHVYDQRIRFGKRVLGGRI